MLQPIHVAREFEDISLANEIRSCIGARIYQRVAHAGLRREVEDDIVTSRAGAAGKGCTIGYIHLFERELRMLPELIQPRIFQPRIVIRVERIDPAKLMPSLKQCTSCVKSNEPRCSGNQDSHCCLIRY